ncbi:hypothetical protein F3J37_18080 [Pantoea sp. Al-1710]|uniref:DUF7739 domain-containing protein n=1 Tax=Candidatus Pantoea communis TaxID=2608354 RepID=A0ABX0RSJ2_9GAMM|nr:hypothetical protein [Pantoea communis]NIG20587.1 hypothetical protein [Pantoea communis]
MSVSLTDKRRAGQRVSGIDLPNGTWFKVLAIPGMERLVNTQNTNDPLDVTPAKARKMADLLEPWTPPDGWCNGNDREWHAKMKAWLIEFFRNCNGFRSH